MKKILFYTSCFSFFTQMGLAQITLSDTTYAGVAPRLTVDHRGNPVISWAEKDAKDLTVAFRFAVSEDGGRTFGKPVIVPVPPETKTHAEGMPKIAFKADGTLLVVYEVKRSTPENRFLGDVMYRMSADGGKNWLVPGYVHTDTSRGKSRSYFDITRLPNGEIGAVWLGETSGKDGRPLRFAQTKPGGGFGPEVTAKAAVCQCCRTNIMTDSTGAIHLFFRDILPDGARDIGHVISMDGGRTFGDYRRVHPDQWKVAGCPHTGPSSVPFAGKIFTAWFTGEETAGEGVKLSDNAGKLYTHIQSPAARHPQLTVLGDRLVLAWDEPIEQESGLYSLVHLRYFSPQGRQTSETITEESENADFPAILGVGKQVLVAYESTPKGQKSRVRVRVVAVR